MTFTRKAETVNQCDRMMKAAKELKATVTRLTAMGTWRSLNPIGDRYVDFNGPFDVTRGEGPAFIRDDGTEVFMLDKTAHIIVEVTP